MPRPRPATLGAALLLLLLAVPAAAQRSSQAVGFQAGYARADLSVEGLDGTLEARAGAYVGVYYRTRVLPWLWLQPEINFTIKGGEIPSALPGLQSLRLDLGVLEVPLLARVSTPWRRNSIRPMVFGGASVGFEIGCGRTFIFETTVRSVECGSSGTITIEDQPFTVSPIQVGSPDISWVLGGGIQWERRDINIAVEARYQRGLRQVLPEASQQVRSQLWAILIALTI